MPSRCSARPASALAALACFLVLFLASAAQAAPLAPTNLRGVTTASLGVTLIWDDNSTDETGFVITYTLNGAAAQTLPAGASTGTGTTGGGFTLPAGTTTATFKVAAVNGAGTSATTNTITMTPASFGNPTNPLLVTQPDGGLRFMWTDNAFSEVGYFIEYATASAGPYTVLGSTAASNGIDDAALGGPLATNTTYFFRARGFLGTASSPTSFTAYTTPVSATTGATMFAPTSLVATSLAPTETSVNLSFTDNTGLNTGYSIEYCLSGTNSFVAIGTAGDFSTITVGSFLAPGTAYDFRLRAYYDPGNGNFVYSGYSNIATYTTPFNAPTGLSATVVSDTQVNLAWTQNSTVDQGTSIYYRPSGSGSFTLLAHAPTVGASSYSATALTPGTAYDFQVKAAFARNSPGTPAIVESAPSNTSSASTKDGFTSPSFLPITYGQSFSYQSTTSSLSARTSWSTSTLPSGLNFNSSTGAITGTPTVSGLFSVTLTATFASGWTAHETLNLRIVRPPTAPAIVTTLPATKTFSIGDAAAQVSISGAFTDPDVESAVRLVTTKGNIDVLLYNAETPTTVTNFLGYVNRGDYNTSAFHRLSSIATDGVAVLQGGEFKTAATGITNFTSITAQPNIQNEPGISNLSYTIAMAKQGGDPNSANSQFYFNLNDLDSGLDSTANDGGFTVFGRVSGATKANVDAITSSPTGGPYTISADGTSVNQGFLWPMNVANQASVPATMDNTKIMTIVSAAPLTQAQMLTYTVGSSNSAVATASLAGTTVTITPVSAGAATITVTATDLDGMATNQTINVTVNQTLAQWATSQGLSGQQAAATADPDQDGFTNLQEFAFLTNPAAANAVNPVSSVLANTGPTSFCQITFPVRKFAPSLTYTVEASDTLLANSWTTIWTSANGFGAPAVISAVDQTDRTVLTVRDTAASPPATHRFMRVTVSSP